MEIFFLALLALIIAIYVTTVQFGSKKIVATGYVISGNKKVETKIDFSEEDKKQLYAMALLYASKIKWLILTDPPLSLKIFRNVFNNTLNEWPEVPMVEMISSLDEGERIYKVELSKIKNRWSIITHLPKNGYAGDLVTNYFFLLKAIVNELTKDEKEKLGDMFKNYSEQCKLMSSQSKSYFALLSEQKIINNLLSNL